VVWTNIWRWRGQRCGTKSNGFCNWMVKCCIHNFCQGINLLLQVWLTNQKRIRFLDPLFLGKYPLSMKKLVGERLPEISQGMSKLLVGSLDFVGINHYTTLYVRNDRTRIRKLILQDASSDAAVITTCKMSKYCSIYLKKRMRYQAMNWLSLSISSIAAYRRGVAIGERVCPNNSLALKILL
jgi:hypothetical protein